MATAKEIVAKYKGQSLNGKPRANATQIVAKYNGGVKKAPRVAPKVDPKIISQGEQAKQFLNRSTVGQIFSKQFAKEIPKATLQTVVANPVKFGISVKEIPEIAIKRKFTNKEYNVPGLGKTTSFQTDYGKVAEQVVKGKKGLGSAAWSLAQIPLAGMETAGAIGTARKAVKGITNANSLANQVKVLQATQGQGKQIPTSIKPLPSSQVPQKVAQQSTQQSTQKLPQKQSLKVVQEKPKTGISSTKGDSSYTNSTIGKEKNRGFIDTVRGSQMTDKEVVKAVSSTYTPRETEKLVQEVNKIIKSDVNKAKDIAYAGSSDESVAMSMELIKHYQNQGDFDSAVQIAEDVAQKLTESGRAIQAASIYNRLTPEGIVRYAQKQINTFNKANPKKPIKLTGSQAKELTELSKEAQSLEGEAKAIATQRMLDKVGEFIPSSKVQQAITIWKAGLLTNPSTHIANVTGNATMLGLENIKDIPATGMDILASLFTGKRTKALPSMGAQAQGMGEGIRKASQFAVTGIDPENVLAKVDYQKVNLPPVLKQYTDTVFRALGVGDKIFRQTLFKKSLYELAQVDGINQGLKGQQLVSHIDDLVKQPPVSMVEQATQDALYGTFNSKNMLAEGLSRGKQALGRGRAIADFIMPFTQTPTNVAARIADYSPLGFVKAGAQAVRGSGQRNVVESLGRGITGTGIAGIGYGLGKEGNLSGTMPTNETEKNLWELQGKTPNSVKIGDTWYNMDKLAPLGNVLGMGGQYAQNGSLAETAGQTAKGLKDMTFLKGMSSAMDALNDPKRYASSYVENSIASLVPSIVAAYARNQDPVKREVNGVSEAIMNRLPGMRQSLLPNRDALGNEVYYEGNQMFSPMRTSSAKNSPVANEIIRLNEMGGSISLSNADKKVGLLGGAKVELTPEQYDQMNKESGGIIQKLVESAINTPQYQNSKPVDQARFIEKVIQKARELSKYRAIGKDNTTDEIRKYLQEKNSKPFYQ